MPNYGDGLKGAAGGAATGAAIGSVVPGYGTAIGGAIGGVAGGLIGLFGGGDDQKKKLEEYRKMLLARDVPQLGPAAQATTSDFRGNQQGLISRLEAMANGTAPSMADAQLRSAVDRNTATQQSFAQSGRGNPTLAAILAANNSNNFSQGAAQQAVAARIAEQQGAIQQLGAATGQARQQDQADSQFNAQQQNFAAQANLEARLRAMGLSDQAVLNIMQQMGAEQNRVTTGDQLMAGGVGALGMYAGQRGASKAAQA